MALSKTVFARVDRQTAQFIERAAKQRRRQGARVSGADIIREALIEYFERRPETEKESEKA